MSRRSKHFLLGLGLAGLLFETVARPALAVDKVSLFKVATPRGEIVIGLTSNELAKMKGRDASAVANTIADLGALDVWQYGERRSGDGEITYVPVKLLGLQWRDTIRVEGYATRDKVIAINDYTMK